MTTRTLRILSGAVMLACALMAQADTLDYQPGDQLPVSPQVKIGKLANGLTYYIQKNGKPEQNVELRLVVKAGSILEDDDQRGLAHFTEHMAFNGSTHFKRNELISYLESIGVKFGADLNAYTSFDETVYMLPIPTDKKDNLETGFNVLEDWAHGLSFNDADIDSERAIIMEELRRGKGADDHQQGADAETVERFALRRASADRQGRRHPALPARRDPPLLPRLVSSRPDGGDRGRRRRSGAGREDGGGALRRPEESRARTPARLRRHPGTHAVRGRGRHRQGGRRQRRLHPLSDHAAHRRQHLRPIPA